MYHPTLSEELKSHCPEYCGAAVYAEVTNTPYCEGLWQEINNFTRELRASETADSIKLQPAIAATREAVGPYVDIIMENHCANSIGGFDADKIQGTDLCLGVGHADEPFEGIGRGVLNIEGLPVLRDAAGGIGTPTSDHERTKMDVGTRHILAIINGYDGNRDHLQEAALMTQELLKKYASSDGGTICYFE